MKNMQTKGNVKDAGWKHMLDRRSCDANTYHTLSKGKTNNWSFTLPDRRPVKLFHTTASFPGPDNAGHSPEHRDLRILQPPHFLHQPTTPKAQQENPSASFDNRVYPLRVANFPNLDCTILLFHSEKQHKKLSNTHLFPVENVLSCIDWKSLKL